jgi:hypothetical protein
MELEPLSSCCLEGRCGFRSSVHWQAGDITGDLLPSSQLFTPGTHRQIPEYSHSLCPFLSPLLSNKRKHTHTKPTSWRKTSRTMEALHFCLSNIERFKFTPVPHVLWVFRNVEKKESISFPHHHVRSMCTLHRNLNLSCDLDLVCLILTALWPTTKT